MKFNKSPRAFTIALVMVATVAIVNLVKSNYEWHQNEDKIPAVSRGTYRVFSAELSDTMQINEVDATEQYIYILYSGLGVVAVYDWTGEYQYSMSFFTNTNGVMQMRCVDGLLYISDRENYEYVFSKDDLVCQYEPSDKTHIHTEGWFNKTATQRFVVEDNSLYTQSGDYVMDLPGRLY